MDIKTNGAAGSLNAYVHQTTKQPEKGDAQDSAAAANQAPAKKDEVTLSAQARAA